MTVKHRTLRLLVLIFAAVCSGLLGSALPLTGQVAVLHREGLVHGFLALSTMEGKLLADGDLIQEARGDRVTTRLVFHFRDGSLHDETAVFSQSGEFRLLRDHLVQKGPTFPHPMEVSINATTGQVIVRYNEDGKEKVSTDRIKDGSALANGLILTLLKNIRSESAENKLSMVAAIPKPRVVKLVIASNGEDQFSVAGVTRKATHYVVKVEIGGLAGLVAPLVGKEPVDTHVWILGGEAPAFVKSEGPLYFNGPLWRIELASPIWTHASDTRDRKGGEINP